MHGPTFPGLSAEQCLYSDAGPGSKVGFSPEGRRFVAEGPRLATDHGFGDRRAA
jgi:hypothetical protein